MCVSMFKCNEVFKKKAIDYASSSSKSVCVNINIMSLDNTGTVPKTTEQLASPPHPLPPSLTHSPAVSQRPRLIGFPSTITLAE